MMGGFSLVVLKKLIIRPSDIQMLFVHTGELCFFFFSCYLYKYKLEISHLPQNFDSRHSLDCVSQRIIKNLSVP